MILKGGSRGNPKQLAYHLQRVDTNERVTILELQHPIKDPEEAFYCWQALSEGSPRAKKGLYHLNIDPHERYEMTPEKWQRAVEIAEKQLGFEGQSRCVVLHEKDGREHIHVVWCRMDYEAGRLRSDSQNYLKHEKASLAMEREFGHQHVPGKHAKRDREKQSEFPRAEYNHTEWQQAERGGLDARERKAQIRALQAAAGNGQEFNGQEFRRRPWKNRVRPSSKQARLSHSGPGGRPFSPFQEPGAQESAARSLHGRHSTRQAPCP